MPSTRERPSNEPSRRQNLSVTFRQDGRAIEAVRKVSFAIEPGETVALVGESGRASRSRRSRPWGCCPIPPP
jgi:predicted ABC-type transport system involved in lysophospholipase L1 biosynthesis ATPase subunit